MTQLSRGFCRPSGLSNNYSDYSDWAERLLIAYRCAIAYFAAPRWPLLPVHTSTKPARVLLVDDDEVIRLSVALALRGERLQVAYAETAAAGLRLSIELEPDLIISDINLPDGSGFDLLEKLRGYAPTARLPVIVLTSLGDRGSFRRGMTLGADDYLSKPFTRQELLDAVRTQLSKSALIERNIASEVDARSIALQREFAATLAGRIGTPSASQFITEPATRGVLLTARIHPFDALAERLTPAEITEVLVQYFTRAAQRLQAYGAQQFQYRGDLLLANFVEPAYAVRAALELRLVTQSMRTILQTRFGMRGLPGLAWVCAVCEGPLGITPTSDDPMLVDFNGPTCVESQALNAIAIHEGWMLVTPDALLSRLPAEIHIGQRLERALPSAPGGERLVEIRAMVGVSAPQKSDPGELSSQHRQSIQESAAATAQAVKLAYTHHLEGLRLAGVHNQADGLQFKGYRIVRRIGKGGMSEVFLAERESDSLRCVLKVLDLRDDPSERMLARFIQEYTLVSQIHHPNVVRIYDQGFAERHAFIAMEYMDNGDLRSLVKARLPAARIVDLMLQAARALAAVHGKGIVHRDLKPENLMLRADGTLALADFGIAKAELSATLTQHDHIVGTPYYISPEQATTGEVSGRSDLYSLGVIFFELLSGTKPYRGDSISQILGLHIHAPVPQLRPPRPSLQGLIDSLLAKKPHDRVASAEALIGLLEALPAALEDPPENAWQTHS